MPEQPGQGTTPICSHYNHSMFLFEQIIKKLLLCVALQGNDICIFKMPAQPFANSFLSSIEISSLPICNTVALALSNSGSI